MGTGPFAVPSAEQLRIDGHEIPLVVTRPLVDPNAKKLPPRPVFDWATANRFKIYEPTSINDDAAIEELKTYEADLFFVCDYGQILSNTCLSAARLGGINLHGSTLPRHRGAAPVQWALLRGDQRAGVTVIHMTPRLDAGPAIAADDLKVNEDETAAELEPRLAQLGVKMTTDSVEQLGSWDGESQLGEIQDKSLVTKAPRFAKQDGQLDFRLSASYLSRLVRACQPWPGCFAELAWPPSASSKQKKIRVIARAARFLQSPLPDIENKLALEPGSVIEFLADAEEVQAMSDYSHWEAPWARMLAVRCTDGVLLIGRVQPAGKREMDAHEFLRGHPVTDGCRFELPEPPKSALCD